MDRLKMCAVIHASTHQGLVREEEELAGLRQEIARRIIRTENQRSAANPDQSNYS